MPVKTAFRFIKPDYGIKEISEPVGEDAVGITLEQQEGRKGRDVVFSGNDEAQYQIFDNGNFAFEYFNEAYNLWGDEAEVQYLQDWGDGWRIIGDVNFGEGFDTDSKTFATFNVIQTKREAAYKRNFDVAVDLIKEGITLQKALIKAKPIAQRSELKLIPFQFNYEQPTAPNEFAFNTNSVYFNPIQQITVNGVESTLAGWLVNFNTDTGDSFRVLQADDTKQNVTFKFNLNVLYKYRPNEFIPNPNLDKYGKINLVIRWGQSYENSQAVEIVAKQFDQESDANYQLPSNITYTIPLLNQTDIVWIYFTVFNGNGAVNRVQFSTTDMLTIDATSVAIDTVVPIVRYIDAIQKTTEVSSGLSAIAPLYSSGGEFYDTFITSASLLRNLTDKPFYLRSKQIIEEHIRPEINGDYEIDANGNVFIGKYKDFYTNENIGSFDNMKFEGYSKLPNLKYALNQYTQRFKTYQSQKENDRANTYDEVHAEQEYKLNNENAENTRQVEIGFVRSAFSWEETRRKGFTTPDTAATQDDDKVFIADFVPLQAGSTRTTTFFLQHRNTGTPDLNLAIRSNENERDFAWTLLGLEIGSTFEILSGGNIGVYTITSIDDVVLGIRLNNGGIPIGFDGINTQFRYRISDSVKWVIRTNEGFSEISGLANGFNYANLAWTNGRIMSNFYSEELAAANFFYPNKPITNTLYKNNPGARTRLTNEQVAVVEGADFLPTGAILSRWLYNLIIICTRAEFEALQIATRSQRGFIRTWDIEGLPLLGYPKTLQWTPYEKQEQNAEETLGTLNVTLEERYQPFLMTITADDVLVTINGENMTGTIKFSYNEFGKFTIFDNVGKILYNPVRYDRIRLNNSNIASSPEELAQWLSEYASRIY